MMITKFTKNSFLVTLFLLLMSNGLLFAISSAAARQQVAPKPPPVPAKWQPLIGEYALDNDTLIVLEKDGKLHLLFKRTELDPLREVSKDKFQFESNSTHSADQVVFSRNASGKVTQVEIGKSIYKRQPLGPEEGSNQLRVEPLQTRPHSD